MILKDNWQQLLKKSWAIRWATLAGLLSGAEVILPLFIDTMPRYLFASLSLVATAGGIWARLLAQPKDNL